jgi:PhzF family phenazine biosynthesis protein
VRVRIVDAFTDRPYTGNPAAVCLLDGESWPPQRWLEQVAAELSVPMTAFGHRLPARGGADWALRWFLPTGIEEDLCGHATLAAAHVLRSDGAADGTIRFSTRSGVLLARAADDTMITLDFPAAPVTGSDAPADLAVALGAEPVATYRADKLRDLLVVLPDEAAVRALAPDFAALARLTRREGLRGVIPTAVASGEAQGYDFVSRFFSPADGIPEDPVTGSAHTALAPYWAGRLRRDVLTGLQASARSGLVHTRLLGHRVRLTGHAVTVLDGTLRDPGYGS